MDGVDTVGAAQIGIARKMIVSGKSANQLRNFCNIINDFVRNLKRRLFVFHSILAISFSCIISRIAHFINHRFVKNDGCCHTHLFRNPSFYAAFLCRFLGQPVFGIP